MKSKWAFAIPIAAILVVSAIGIGFAYSANTQNDGNSMDVKYLTIRTSSDAAGETASYTGMVNFTDDGLGSVIWDSYTNLYKVGEDTGPTEHIVWKLATGDGENVVDDSTDPVTHRQLVTDMEQLGDNQAALLIGTLYFTIGDENATFGTTYDLKLQHAELAGDDAPAKVYARMYTGAIVNTEKEFIYSNWVDVSAAATGDSYQTLSVTAGYTTQYLKMELYAVYDGYYEEDQSETPIAIGGIVTDADDDLNYTFSGIVLSFKALPHEA